MTEVSQLKTCVSIWQAESHKLPKGQITTKEMDKLANQANAIINSNPVAGEQFVEKYPHFEESLEKIKLLKQESEQEAKKEAKK